MFGVWTYQRTMLTPALRKRSKLVNRDFASFHAYNALARKPDNVVASSGWKQVLTDAPLVWDAADADTFETLTFHVLPETYPMGRNSMKAPPPPRSPSSGGRSGRARGVHRRTARALPYPAPGGQVVMRRPCSQTCCNQRPFYFFSTLCLIELCTLWNSE